MALDSYSNLKTAIVNFSGRDDLTTLLDDFIDMAEQEMYFNSQRPLRVRQMETRSTLTTVAGNRFLALPTGYLEPRAMVILRNGERLEMKYVAPAALEVQSTDGLPHYFTITSQIEFDREPDDAYSIEFQHYAKPTALSSASPTNDILDNYPTIYLYGALSALYDYSRELQDSQVYYQKMIEAIMGATKGDKAGRYGPTPAGRVQGSIV